MNKRKLVYPWLMGLVLVMSSCGSSPKNIAVQPMGNFPVHLTDTVKNTLHRVYGFPVHVLSNKEIPEHTFTKVKSPRYRADQLIRFLKDEQPDSVAYTIGLLQKDISTTKRDANGEVKKPAYKYKDWGVFGLGYRPGPSCVVSTFRFKNREPSKFISRLKKISVHEIGHNLGLPHCPNKQCVMTDAAESINTIDQVKLELCKECKSQI